MLPSCQIQNAQLGLQLPFLQEKCKFDKVFNFLLKIVCPQVCSSCYIKLRLPVEKLREVTVASLISQLSPVKVTNESKTNTSEPPAAAGFVRSSLNRISLRSSKQTKQNDSRKISSPTPSNTSASTYRPRMIR